MEPSRIKTEGNSQRLISEAIKKIALGRSFERTAMSPAGMGGVGTARMIHGYVAKIHDDPHDREFEEYAGTIDVGEFPDETPSSEPVLHKGVLLSGVKDNAGGFLIIPTLYSDVTIVSDAATSYMYVLNFSHADIIQLQAHKEVTVGVVETEELDTQDNDSPDYDQLDKTGNEAVTRYTASSIITSVRDSEGSETVQKITPGLFESLNGDTSIIQHKDSVSVSADKTAVTVESGKITLGSVDATEPLVLGNELAQLMLDFLTECSKIMTPTLMGTMPAINAAAFSSPIPKIKNFLSKTSFTE